MKLVEDGIADLFGFDAKKSREARDAALDQVSSHNNAWMAEMLTLVASLPKGWRGTGEDIRRLAIERGCEKPKHHNAWGGLINAAVRRRLLEGTGVRLRMRAVTSHARKTDEYQRP